jgi:integral membrane protein (TIGR00529 family)
MSDLIFLVLSLVLIAILIRFKINIGISIFVVAMIMSIYKGISIVAFPSLIIDTLKHLDTINLMLVFAIVTYLAEIWKISGFLDDIIYNFEKIFPPKVSLPLFTIVIGLLSMPGGALVSAPMIEYGARNLDLKGEDKALLNFWFRHIWEPISPLFPEFLLEASIIGVSIGKLIGIQWPVAVGMLISGIVFIMPKIPDVDFKREKVNFEIIFNIFKSISPIILIFVFLMLFKTLPSFIAMFVGLIYVLFLKKVNLQKMAQAFKFRKILEYVFLIFSVFLLREIINKTNFAMSIYNELQFLNLPNFIILFFLPFSIGFLAGISSASIGIAFPLLMPLLAPNNVVMAGRVLIAYLGVWTALLTTPTHLCLSLSVDYFKASFSKFYKGMVKPIFLLALITLAWYLIISL